MRSYTTWSLVGAMAFCTATVAVGIVPQDRVLAAVAVGVGAITTWHSWYWERGGPWWLTALAVATGLGLWWTVVIMSAPTIAVALPAITIAVVTAAGPLAGWGWTAAGGVLLLLPTIPVALLEGPGMAVLIAVAVAVGYGVAVTLIRFTHYGWGLSLELDRARLQAAELAVMQERYRFAADLHDIQGQALHVARLDLQLARRLVDADPARAAATLAEVEELLASTIAETRSLAYGEREVALASELANSGELIRAAGIELEVVGEPRTGGPLDALLGLAVRETTTNLLRHAQPAHVRIDFPSGGVRIVNDGVDAPIREPRGLARLGERVQAAGGVLTSRAEGDTFTTEVRPA